MLRMFLGKIQSHIFELKTEEAFDDNFFFMISLWVG
jgi:hypothetical protein